MNDTKYTFIAVAITIIMRSDHAADEQQLHITLLHCNHILMELLWGWQGRRSSMFYDRGIINITRMLINCTLCTLMCPRSSNNG